jgi:hypothetical protein
MRNTVHNRRFDLVKEEVKIADQFICKLRRPEEGDFLGSMFKNQMIDLMNRTNQLLNLNETFDYTDPTPMTSTKFLLPLPNKLSAEQHLKGMM